MRKKFAVLFTDSAREFKKVRTVTACGLFAALALVLNSFSIQLGPYLRIGVSGLPNEMVDVLFGPVAGGLFAAAMDLLKLMIYPSGAWIPGLTLNCLLAGLIYGSFLYRRPTSFWRILAAELTVALLVNVALGTFWLSQFYGKAFLVMLPARLIKNLVKAPVDALILYLVMRVLERAGVFRMLKIFRPAPRSVWGRTKIRGTEKNGD
ncbi:MAG: folate family ECF transporter S component [Eubacteriales bacterium]|nr:folate family ECF transporter S component [Eubacteriales bacterium]